MDTACVSFEPFALQMLDDSMAPDFPAGAVVVVDPGEPPEDGCFVVLEHDGGVQLRRLRLDPSRGGAGRARFAAPGRPDLVPEGDWRHVVRGVVTGVRLRRERATACSSTGRAERPDGPGGR